MSYIWSFSQKSKRLLQQCLDDAAIIPPDPSNKWLHRFGPRNLDLIKKDENTVILEDSPEMLSIPPEDYQEDILKVVEELKDPDFNIAYMFDVMQMKWHKTPIALTKLAENLPAHTIDKLTCHIFDSTDIDKEFLNVFYEYFLPIYIRKINSRICTELLFKTYKLHSQCFKILLKWIFKDLNKETSIIHDFIITLDARELTEFLITIGDIMLSGEELKHNLFNIYTAYKGCNKTVNVQNVVLTLLKTHCVYCSTDKNFGKLFLAYLQHEKSFNSEIDCTELDSIIEKHKSPFKRLCLAVLEEIKNS